eukprot:983195-Alexandrium_andersonii.AAC.1
MAGGVPRLCGATKKPLSGAMSGVPCARCGGLKHVALKQTVAVAAWTQGLQLVFGYLCSA